MDRELNYRIRTEDQSSAALDSVANSAARADASLDGVADASARVGAQTQQTTIGVNALAAAQARAASLGIQTSASINKEIAELEQLGTVLQADAVATGQLAERKRALAATLAQATAAQSRFGATSGQAAGFVNNFAFSLNDAQQATFGLGAFIRATSNNLGVMVSQFVSVSAAAGGARRGLQAIRSAMIGPLGISVAVSAVSTALVFLSDAFKKTEEDAEGTAEKLEDEFADLIKIVDAVQGSFEFDFETADIALATLQQRIFETTEAIDAVRVPEVDDPGAQAEAFRLAGEETERLNELLAEYNKQLEAIELRVGNERKIREQIAELEERGLNFTRDRSAEERRAEAAEARRLERLENQKTAEQELVEKRNDLRSAIDDENREDIRTLVILDREIEKLEAAIETRRALFAEEERQNELREEFGDRATPAPVAAAGLELDVTALDGPAGRTARRIAIFRAAAEARGLSEEVLSEAEAISAGLEDTLFSSVEDFIELNERLSDSISNSLAEGVAGFGEALGDVITGSQSFAAIGQTVLLTLSDLGASIGRQLIAFGVAGIAIRRFVTNPIGAIIAGGALIALSRVLRNRVQSQIDGAADGGAGGASDSVFQIPGAFNGSGSFQASGNRSSDGVAAGGFAVPASGVVSNDFTGAAESSSPTLPRVRSTALDDDGARDDGSPELRLARGRLGRTEDALAGVVGEAPRVSDAIIGRASDGVRDRGSALDVRVRLGDPVVLPGGTIVFSLREALTREIENGGSGQLP